MVLLITGCRSGFGLLIAESAGRAGHTVYAGLRDLDTAGELRRRTQGLDVFPLQLDVTSADERNAAVERVLHEQGRIDGLVNNAGVLLGGFLEQIDADELRHLFEVNVFGLWELTKQVLPTLRAQRQGTIVNLSSVSGRMAMPGLGAYAASKFAVEAMSEAWRHELRPFGVQVALIEPGPYRTELLGRNRRVCRAAQEVGPYSRMAARLDALLAKALPNQAEDPQAVADRILEVLEASRPALRHPMGRSARRRLLAKRLLPEWLLERAVARVLRLDGLAGAPQDP